MVLTRARWLLNRLAHPDGDLQVKRLRKDVQRLVERIESLKGDQEHMAGLLHAVERTSAQLKLITALNLRQQQDLSKLPALLDEERIARHVRAAVDAAVMLTDPYEHTVVDRVLPDDVYAMLLRSMPPAEFFNDRDPIKQNLTFPMEAGPTLSISVWEYLDTVIARRIIRPAVVEKFRGPLHEHFATVFGGEFVDRAESLPQSAYGGRLMLRRPGYYLGPHRDPKRAMLTCLMYLAKEGDSEAYGTQIFRVLGDHEASYKQTFYPEQSGCTCELVKVVPFRPNSMLVSLNSRGAHGAIIPADAPADLERYTYQFYVAPENTALGALIKSLPPPKRKLWQNKSNAMPEYA